MTRPRFAFRIVGALALSLFSLAAFAAGEGPVEAVNASQLSTPAVPAEPEPWLLPEPVELSQCTAEFDCPDGSHIQCSDPNQCFVYAYICAIRCGNSNVVKCNDWPPGCEDPCDFSACIGAGGSRQDCETLHCTGFGGPD